MAYDNSQNLKKNWGEFSNKLHSLMKKTIKEKAYLKFLEYTEKPECSKGKFLV